MKLLRQLGIILVILFLGSIVQKIINNAVPGSVIGMIILLILLYTKVLKLEMIEEISKFLLDHLAFFFIPAGVAIISSFNLLKNTWIAILIICFISTIITMTVTGLTVQALKRRQSHD